MIVQRAFATSGLIVVFVYLALNATSCDSGSAAGVTGTAREALSFALDVHEESFLGEPSAGSFTVSVREVDDQVVAAIQVSNARQLKALYCALTYDAGQLTPLSAEPGEAFTTLAEEPRSAGADPLVLDVLSERGVVHYGQLLAKPQQRRGFSGDGELALIRFKRAAFAERTTSEPPQTAASATRPQWNAEARMLSWGYSCQGDYNQDGMVTVSDLTPLGVHFEAEGPFDANSALAVVDGNGDGMITVSDITPIGQNFDCRVEGYMVFASDNPEEVPAHQASEVWEIDFAPLETAFGDRITERLQFAREYPELDPHHYVWVRPLGDGELGTPSWPQIPGLCMWQIHDITSFASKPGGTHNSLCEVNGLPAVSYRVAVAQQLVYQRALNPTGSSWGTEVVVDSGSDLGYFTSLEVVNGNPAIAYYDWQNGDLKYARASDANGATWASPLTVDSTGMVGYDCHLLIANGNPAICYQDMTSYTVKYVRATDASGTTWGAPVTVATKGAPLPPGTGSFISAALVGGNPAIAYPDSNSGTLQYIRATDAGGTSWGSPVKVNPAGVDVGRFCSLFLVHGNPAVAYFSDGVLVYQRAANGTGASWNPDITIDSSWTLGIEPDTCLYVNNGKPAISYYSASNNGDLQYVKAIDADGTNWTSPSTLDGPGDVGTFSCLRNIGTSPAISYYDDTNGHLKFAICVNAFNQPPTAAIHAAPQSVKFGEGIAFDASGSHDPDGQIVIFEWDFNDDGSWDLNTSMEPHAEYTYPEPGFYTPHVRVTDNSGAMELAFTEVEVRANIPPHADLVATPDWGNPPFVVNFDASGSFDDDGTIVNYEWDWDGDGTYEAATDTTPNWSWEYQVPGEFLAAVKVTDDSGDFNIGTVLCTGNAGPTAMISADPIAGPAPLDVQFDGTGSFDSDGSIVEHWWDVHDDGVYEQQASGAPGLWACKLIWNGGVKARLKVRDNGGLFGSAVVTVNVSGGWHISQVDEGGDVGENLSLAIINGRPAISYYDYTNQNLKYVRASNTTGYAWPMPMSLAKISTAGNNACWGTSLAWINGSIPGIAFHATSMPNWQDAYMRGLNANGTSWNALQTIPNGSGHTPSLVVVASNPAIAAVNPDLFYSRAADANGVSWGSQQTIDTDTGPEGCSMAIISGKPAVAYTYRGAGSYENLCYRRANDSTGDSWGSRIIVEPAQYGIETVSMAVIAGRPAIAYTVSTTSGGGWQVRYRRASNTDGTLWPSGFKLIQTNGRGGVSLCDVNGRPAIAMRDCGNRDLLYARASEATGGANWPPATVVDNTDQNTGFDWAECSMISISSKPAIAYNVTLNSALKYAIWE